MERIYVWVWVLELWRIQYGVDITRSSLRNIHSSSTWSSHGVSCVSCMSNLCSTFTNTALYVMPSWKWPWPVTMMTSSNANISASLALCERNPLTKASDAELWCFELRLIKRWANNRNPGDLRNHSAHYDVIVMDLSLNPLSWLYNSRYMKHNVMITTFTGIYVYMCKLIVAWEILMKFLDEYFSSQLQWLMAEIPAVKLPLEECH